MNNRDELLAPVARLLQHSRQLLQFAEADLWLEFEDLLGAEQETLPAMADERWLEAVTRAGMTDEVKEKIKEIQSLKKDIAQCAERSRDRLSARLRESLHKDKAIQAYRK